MSNNDNPIIVVNLLIKELKVKIAGQSVKSKLLAHPLYPSLLSVSDSLLEWNIANDVYKISKNSYNPADLSFPFVAHFPEKGGRFILVHNIIGKRITYSDESNARSMLTQDDFLKRWDGIVLQAHATDYSGETDYHLNLTLQVLRQMMVISAIIITLLIFYFIIIKEILHLKNLFLAIVKLLGIVVSGLLLAQTNGIQNTFMKSVCSLIGKKDCSDVLNSPASNITSWLSWSELGFFYFAGSFLLLLINSSSIGFLAWINLIALPYSVYSLSYQYRIKAWCLLCCIIQGILWFEFSHSYFTGVLFSDIQITTDTIGYILIAFLSPITIWGFLKHFFVDAIKLNPTLRQLNKFKYNNDVFRQILTNQPRYEMPDNLMPIIIGSQHATTIITIVTNPFCEPCRRTHATVIKWLKNRSDVQVKIIFLTENHEIDPRTKIANHFAALNLIGNSVLTEEALNAWYNKERGYNKWANKYAVDINYMAKEVTLRQKNWCRQVNITFTPTIFLNGYKIPDPYQVEDLKYLPIDII